MTETDHNAWQTRMNAEQKMRRDDHRDPFQRDRARILHSAAFRRLQAKTQVHGTGVNDFHRTRLTHSLEAAQLGSGIRAQVKRKQPNLADLLPTSSLMEALCLAHDIGHPPFGHGGEIALNYMMREHGGFEGNAQTFRIVTQLEPYTEHHGMNLTRRALLGLIKYPALISELRSSSIPESVSNQRKLKASDWHPAKGIYNDDKSLFDWVLEPLSGNDKDRFSALRAREYTPFEHKKTQYKSLDCSIMELADDIAYGIHDLEDAIVLGLIHRSQWQEVAASQLAECGDKWFEENIQQISEKLFSGVHYQRKDAIGGIVNALLTSISVKEFTETRFDEPLLRWNAKLEEPAEKALEIFKQFVSRYVIQIPEVQVVEYKGQQIIIDIFEALSGDPKRLLPEIIRQDWIRATESHDGGMRVITDYISSLTDGSAQRLHQQLFCS
ncbi:anti-phage deoxyguanosine triphosphatase [Vibrio penaeicida]|uniref:Deoxyguanosinetriphosphate triphosphohydrolase-like protein n=1 Tax=Vibrio penaeicida TaxID=104609 RepID=A0AAV5NNJ1_9VIBR|nr:anti-phage deoxyguanosine triphosphatase [Vibrio penaeicida]RTZ21992.1 deoxyguanosinetriphosphate triphosphohydrolase family protein [Vibrio penaeicida]GLQ71813.1 deoxyguanosinetriphosphate triphosphohydrolase-like protein [Vibrio penaeicida]